MKKDKLVSIPKEIDILVNDYNEKAKILNNGDVILKDRKIMGKFNDKNDAMIYMLRLGWYYGK